MTELAIDVHGLSKRFGDKLAVNQVDIQMPRGQVWGFLGPNGSGKTTTIRMLCGLLKISEGEGQCLGLDIRTQSRQIRRQTGYMTQHFSFWNDLTIRENLEFVARIYQLPDARHRVDETLAELGLSHRQQQLAGNLSGGWKQRMALAAVTMHNPRLLLLDEPTAGVDPQARRDFWEQIHRLSDLGMTVLVSTHYMDEAERCDHIVYLANGELITQGSVAGIIQQSGLITFRCEQPGARQQAEWLRQQAAIEQVAYFGAALHVSGHNREAVSAALSNSALVWQEVKPDLEDVFISLMHQAGTDQRDYA